MRPGADIRGYTPANVGGGYLFHHKALAKVFRAKVLDAIEHAGLTLPDKLPAAWVVDCKSVGDGRKALLYLGRYLYRGVIRETDIVRCEDGQVSLRYRDAKTGKTAVRTRTYSAPLDYDARSASRAADIGREVPVVSL